MNLFCLRDKMTFCNDIFNCANDGVADRETDSCRISGTDDLVKSRSEATTNIGWQRNTENSHWHRVQRRNTELNDEHPRYADVKNNKEKGR